MSKTVDIFKWHPGHYLASKATLQTNWIADTALTETHWTDLVTDVTNHNFRGIVIRYNWLEMEPTESDYSAIIADLTRRADAMLALDKVLVLLLETRSFTLNDHVAPTWARTATYGGGEIDYGSGYDVCFHNSNVLTKLEALISAIGVELDSHRGFGGIGLLETSTGLSVPAEISSENFDLYYDGMLSTTIAMQTAFPSSLVFGYCNYTREKMVTYVPSILSAGIGLSNPDCFPSNYTNSPGTPGNGHYDTTPPAPVGFAYGVYHYFFTYKGISINDANQIPLIIAVQPNNYDNSVVDGAGAEPTIAELYNFARDSLGVNFVFWTREPNVSVMDTPLQHHERVKNFIDTLPADPVGGLNPVIPVSMQ